MARNKIVPIRFSESERLLLDALTRHYGRSISDTIRQLIANEAKRVFQEASDDRATAGTLPESAQTDSKLA